MSKKKPETEDFYLKLMEATNAVGAPHFGDQAEKTVKVDIRPDESINPGMFKPDPLKPGHFKAHPTTIRAMRKDIFVGGSDEFIDLEQSYICQSCKTELDVQFWLFCPYCEAEFPKDLKLI